MLMPKKTRFRKVQRGTRAGRPKEGASRVIFGEFGLQATEPAWLTSQQIEAARVVMSRKMKKVGKVLLRRFPDKPVTKKPAETRMGKGKGGVEQWVAVIRTGAVIFEIEGTDATTAHDVLRSAQYKLPMRTKIIAKEMVVHDQERA